LRSISGTFGAAAVLLRASWDESKDGDIGSYRIVIGLCDTPSGLANDERD